MNEEFDIVVVGGGMVGATLALALGGSGLRVAVIEAHRPDSREQPSYDDRAIALSWGSSRILDRLDIWPDLQARVEPIRHIHVSDRGRFGVTRIHAREEGVPALGFVVTARDFGNVLSGILSGAAYGGVRWFRPARVGEIRRMPERVEVAVRGEDGQSRLSAALLVAADGAQSSVRHLLGLGAERNDYVQHAIVTNVSCQRPPGGWAYERFTRSGPIALLPMPAHGGRSRAALIWTVPAGEAPELMAAGEREFLDRLQRRFGYRLGRLLEAGRRHDYPLSLVKSELRHSQRVVLLGNAAQSLHPVAGQGFNLALRDTAALLDCLLYPEPAPDPGRPELLERYERSRERDRRRVIRFTDTLIRAFGSPHPLLGCARSAGLTALDTLPALRRLLTRPSMGLNMPLPHL